MLIVLDYLKDNDIERIREVMRSSLVLNNSLIYFVSEVENSIIQIHVNRIHQNRVSCSKNSTSDKVVIFLDCSHRGSTHFVMKTSFMAFEEGCILTDSHAKPG